MGRCFCLDGVAGVSQLVLQLQQNFSSSGSPSVFGFCILLIANTSFLETSVHPSRDNVMVTRLGGTGHSWRVRVCPSVCVFVSLMVRLKTVITEVKAARSSSL